MRITRLSGALREYFDWSSLASRSIIFGRVLGLRHRGPPGKSGRLQCPFGREKTNLHPLIEGSSYVVEHGQRMSLIGSIFQSTDHRGGRAHEFRQLSLREAGFCAKVIDLPGELGVGELLVVGGDLRWVLADIPVVGIFEGARSKFLF